MVTEGFNVEDYSERNIKLKMYKRNNWKNAEKDVDPVIRLNYYRTHGYTKAALNDDFHAIRFEASLSLKVSSNTNY